jgi:hypothetical protein
MCIYLDSVYLLIGNVHQGKLENINTLCSTPREKRPVMILPTTKLIVELI